MELELRRLDDLQSGIYVNALEGDPVSIRLHLDISDRRAKLLGLYPKEPQVHFNIPGADQPELMRIEFVLPDKPPPAPVDVTPQPAEPPDYSRPALEPPKARTVDRGYGIGPWRVEPKPSDWMK